MSKLEKDLTHSEKEELAYARVKEINNKKQNEGFPTNIPASGMLNHYEKYDTFSEKQINWINKEYERLSNYNSITKYSEKTLDKKNLIDFMTLIKDEMPSELKAKKGYFSGIINQLKKPRSTINFRHFNKTKEIIKLIGKEEIYLPSLKELENEFSSVFKGIKNNPKTI